MSTREREARGIPDVRGRRGRIVPSPDTRPDRAELKPPDAYRCWHHDRPERNYCPECISNRESDADYDAIDEVLYGSEV